MDRATQLIPLWTDLRPARFTTNNIQWPFHRQSTRTLPANLRLPMPSLGKLFLYPAKHTTQGEQNPVPDSVYDGVAKGSLLSGQSLGSSFGRRGIHLPLIFTRALLAGRNIDTHAIRRC
jgi:hypothetical protein